MLNLISNIPSLSYIFLLKYSVANLISSIVSQSLPRLELTPCNYSQLALAFILCLLCTAISLALYMLSLSIYYLSLTLIYCYRSFMLFLNFSLGDLVCLRSLVVLGHLKGIYSCLNVLLKLYGIGFNLPSILIGKGITL